MRVILLALIVAIATPAAAQDARHYVNESMGFEAMLPEGFATTYADNEMELAVTADGTREILLLGTNSFDPLERLAERHMGLDERDGWKTRLVSSNPDWAAYAGERDGRMLVVRLIEICPRWQFARLDVIYPVADEADIAPLLDALGASFRATGTANCPE